MSELGDAYCNVEILIDGIPQPIYTVNGQNWVEAIVGKPYEILVSRGYLSTGRIEVVESVDGRDVLRDQVASRKNPGIVIQSTWRNTGWRIDDNHVRLFMFTDPSESIATQATGSQANVGVIGVAVYNEKSYPRTYSNTVPSPWARPDRIRYDRIDVYTLAAEYSSSASFAADSAIPEAKSLSDVGTGMGAEIESHVGHTSFERAQELPNGIIEIQYRTREWLVVNGIIKPSMPSAWPGEGDTGYGRYVK